MKTISIISQKGGAGKTTLALNLAGAAEALGHSCVVIDLDPQASAKGWHDHRQKESPVVISAQASRLDDVLETSKKHGADICIIDTAPHSETAALAAARAADLILIPCRAGILDLRGISSSVDLVQLAKRPALIVLNAVPPRSGMADQAAEAIRKYGIEVASIRVSQRAAFNHSLTAGQTAVEYEPEGIAAEEIRALYLLACKQAGMITRNKPKQGEKDRMSKKPSLAAALQTFDRAPATPAAVAQRPAPSHAPRSRHKAKARRKGEGRSIPPRPRAAPGRRPSSAISIRAYRSSSSRSRLTGTATIQDLLREASQRFVSEVKKPTIA